MKKLSDQQLLQKLDSTVVQEKKLTLAVLKLLQEVENRKLYADLGHHTLFSYLTKDLGYSEAEASVRVNATRLVNSLPSAQQELEKGTISLTQASKIQTFFRQEASNSPNKQAILDQLAGKSTRQTEKILQQLATVPKDRQQKIIIKQRLLEKIEQIQQDLGNDLSEIEVIESLVDSYLTKKKSARPSRTSTIKPKNQRYLTRQVKEQTDLRARGRCEYISPDNGQRCNCRTNLVYDHIKPIAVGGQSTASNIRKLCFTHNQRAAIIDFGVDKVGAKVNLRGRPSG